MLAGILQIIFGVLKLGRYVTMMPYTVISGFMSGIGVILIILQLAPFLGQASPKGGVVGTVQNIPTLIANINPIETLLAVITVAILFLYPAKLKEIFTTSAFSVNCRDFNCRIIFGQCGYSSYW